MSFLQNKRLNPHILLHALTLAPLNSLESTPIKRLNLLARTRRFQDILTASAQVKDLLFPTLQEKLKQAKNQSEKAKSALGYERVFEIIKELQVLSKGQDPNFEQLDADQQKIYKLSQILFEEGQYSQSLKILVQLQKQDQKEELWLKTTWGRLYNEIILSLDSTKTLQALKKKIDDIQKDELAFYGKQRKKLTVNMKKYYAQKEEFLLLSCFTFWNADKANEDNLQRFVEYCTADKNYFSVVQLTFPEVLRYLIVAIALNKTLHNNRSFDLFKLVEVINRKIVNYKDSFTEYIALLHTQYNFQAAAMKIEECKAVIKDDVFLSFLEERIIEGLQFLYFKLACRVYEALPLSQVTKFTGKSADEAQLWILGYIRSGDIEAKIDSISGIIQNNKNRHNAAERYVQVIPSLNTFVNSLSRAIANQ